MTPIDRGRVRHSFDMHAAEYDQRACVQKRVVRKIAHFARARCVAPARVLDIGSGTGMLLREITPLYPRAGLFGVDLAQRMCVEAGDHGTGGRTWFATGDAERLPVSSDAFGLVLSTSTFQWLDSLTMAFSEVYRVLEPGAPFLVALFGEGTLHELRNSYRAAWRAAGRGEEERTQRFFSPGEVASAFDVAGFTDCSVFVEDEVEYHPDVPTLLRSIRGIGAANPTPVASRGLSERRVMLDMMSIYEERHKQGKMLPATYRIIYGFGVKP